MVTDFVALSVTLVTCPAALVVKVVTRLSGSVTVAGEPSDR